MNAVPVTVVAVLPLTDPDPPTVDTQFAFVFVITLPIPTFAVADAKPVAPLIEVPTPVTEAFAFTVLLIEPEFNPLVTRV